MHASSLVTLDAAPGRDPPAAFRIWPYGTIRTTKGDFLFDKKAAASVMATHADYANRVTFDYQHLAVDPDARAGDGKSAGSCLLELRADGLWAVDVRWTPQAARQLADREWLYFSPAFLTDKKTGRILELVNIALTNVPATKGMTPLVAADRRTMTTENTVVATEAEKPAGDEDSMTAKAEALKAKMAKLKDELAKLGEEYLAAFGKEPEHKEPDGDEGSNPTKAPDGDGDEIPGAFEEKKKAAAFPPAKDDEDDKPAKCSRVETAARKAWPGKIDDEIVGELAALRLTGKDAEVAKLTARIAELETRDARREVEAKVAEAVKAGRILPRDREEMISLGIDNRVAFDVVLSKLQPVIKTATTAARPLANGDQLIALSNDERAIAERMGVPAEKYIAQKRANLEAAKAHGIADASEED